jgi:hypothetical protein
LIVSNNGSHQPVALLFAGSSSTTIGNPISEVLAKVSAALGRSLTFVGDNCTASTIEQVIPDNSNEGGPTTEAVERAMSAMRTRENDLLSRPGIIGVGVGASDTGPNEAAIVVYVDVNSPLSASVPRRINGVRVRKVFTEPFIAY